MSEKLSEVETRILGALIEKQLTTPEYYPLTLNALVAACNQKTNREPIVAFTDETVTTALENLREKNVVYVFYGSTSRVAKYKHILPEVYELSESETALIAVLMLRGAQTLGELRERTGRLYEFSGLGEINETLEGLMRREEPLATRLERQAGQKEIRFAHLLSGTVAAQRQSVATVNPISNSQTERIEKLESEIETLREEISDFRQTFEEFRKQFE